MLSASRVSFRDFHEIPLSATAPRKLPLTKEIINSSSKQDSRVSAIASDKNEAQPAKWKGDYVGVASFVIRKIIYNYACMYNMIVNT